MNSIRPRRLSMFAIVGLCIGFAPRAPVDAAELEVNGKRFTIADGLEIVQAAGPPLVDRPIGADFDELGRLYVSDSSGSNDDVETQLKTRPHRIVRLEDSDGDGRFDKSVVFADKMMFPEGVLWHDGSLYVAAAPSIWKLTDTDADGTADRREEWFNGKTLTGCANDLHGPYLGPDGWIYWCKGAFAEQVYEREGRKPLVTRAAHIFRRRPEGGEIEPVMTGGMDNPVEVVFTPGGERIFSTTFLQHPAGGRRDGLIHAIYGGVYGKIHSVIDGHPRTGPVMPVLTHFGAGAPCGLVRLEANAFGEGYRDNLLCTLFNMQKVTRHVLAPDGATFSSHDEDFLSTDDIDFHPTDVLEDADGSVLVIDTGGWYKLCCPTSHLWKPDLLGAIYRIRPANGNRIDDPRGLALDWASLTSEDLVRLLGDGRRAVRRRATQTLARQGAKAVPALAASLNNSASPSVRREAVWTLTRLTAPEARVAVRRALEDVDETVRQAALHSMSVWRDEAATRELLAMLKQPSLHNRRAAAEALGRIGDSSAVPYLLEAARTYHDRVLEHSLIFALIEIGDARQTRPGLASDFPHVHRAALVALDQMEGARLAASDVAPLLSSTHTELSDTAWWIAERHPEWGATLADYFRHQLTAANLTDDDLRQLAKRLATFAGDPQIQSLMAAALRGGTSDDAAKMAVLDAMAQSGLQELPEAWSSELVELLGSSNANVTAKTVSTLRSFAKSAPNAAAVAELLRLARDSDVAADVRVQALAAARADKLEMPDVRFLCDHLTLETPPSLRSLAADMLSQSKLDGDQLAILADAFATTGTVELKQLLAAFNNCDDVAVGRRLIESLDASPAATALEPDELKTQLARFGESLSPQAETLLAKIRAARRDKHEKVEQLLAALDQGDVRRGHHVFKSTKAACFSCHAMGYLGGTVGPDLSHIGRIRSERDLAEAVLFPSVSFVRSYEPVTVVTSAGLTYNGVVRDETSDELILALDAEKSVRIAHADIEQRQPGTVSIMPNGLEKNLTQQDLVDLIAFLKASQ